MPNTPIQISLYTPAGVRLDTFPPQTGSRWSRAINTYGTCTLTLDPNQHNPALFATDNLIVIERGASPGLMTLENETVYLIQDEEYAAQPDGKLVYTVTGCDLNHILKRRIIAYASGTSYADKSATAADNIMKALVRENLGVLATDTARAISTYLQVQADGGLGQATSLACAYDDLLTDLQKLANDSTTKGTYLCFDMVVTTLAPLLMEFRTYTGQRGLDHRSTTALPITLSLENNGLLSATRRILRENEVTFAYAGGQGTGTNRPVATQSNTVQSGISPFRRMEDFTNASSGTTTASVQAAADALIRDKRYRKEFDAVINPESGYGVLYGWGDVVTAEYLGESLDCRIDAVQITIADNGQEQVDAKLRSVL